MVVDSRVDSRPNRSGERPIAADLAYRSDVNFAIGEGELSVALPDVGVELTADRFSKRNDTVGFEEFSVVHHERGDETPLDYRAFLNGVWAIVRRFVDEIDRVGDWASTPELAESLSNCDSKDIHSATFQFDEEAVRQHARVESPRTGVEVVPDTPEAYYPWRRPRYRPVVYRYMTRTSHSSTHISKCPICGDRGLKTHTSDGVGCHDHGGFHVVPLPPDWVRADDSKYHRQMVDGVRRPIDAVKIIRDEQVKLIRTPMGSGAQLKPKDVRIHGYDMSRRQDYGDIRKGVDEETGEEIIFDKREVVAVKPLEIDHPEKPWADGTDYDLERMPTHEYPRR